ncbi:uncharacterized protein LOC133187105 [Saccostrea echinata]|uniref:uncharacterized protein LOC133187105 n=1 Tax=Saccostrea echinata TaxID=191078 RepID=UPI002A839185|nr:uncharacterized protein LOC133187105 [Saccostrea echinata]
MKPYSILLTVFMFFFTIASATVSDKNSHLCERLKGKELYKMYCYQHSIYNQCKKTCSESLLLKDNGNKKYVENGCPWGNYKNYEDVYMDSNCNTKIQAKNGCDKYCKKPSNVADKTIGWNCCLACVDSCGKTPARDATFNTAYPEVFASKTRALRTLLSDLMRATKILK